MSKLYRFQKIDFKHAKWVLISKTPFDKTNPNCCNKITQDVVFSWKFSYSFKPIHVNLSLSHDSSTRIMLFSVRACAQSKHSRQFFFVKLPERYFGSVFFIFAWFDVLSRSTSQYENCYYKMGLSQQGRFENTDFIYILITILNDLTLLK